MACIDPRLLDLASLRDGRDALRIKLHRAEALLQALNRLIYPVSGTDMAAQYRQYPPQAGPRPQGPPRRGVPGK